MNTKTILITTGILISLIGCKRAKEPLPSEPQYFPLEVGKYITYEYTVIDHDPLQETSDTSTTLLRERIESVLTDAAGLTNYKVALEQSTDDGRTWVFKKYILHYNTAENAFRVEDNIRKAKLSFPLRERKLWDANVKNSIEYQRARMIDLSEQKVLLGKVYDNTLTVDLGEDIDPFFQTKEEEIYAEGIGLVYREYKDLETQPTKYINGIEIFKTIYSTNWQP